MAPRPGVEATVTFVLRPESILRIIDADGDVSD